MLNSKQAKCSTSRKKRKKLSLVTNLPQYKIGNIRDIIYNFQKQKDVKLH